MHMIIDYHYCNYFTHNEEEERIWVSSSSPVSVNTFDSNSKHLPRSPNTIFSLGQGIPSFSNKKVWNTFSCPGVFMTLRHIACFIWYTWVHIAWKSITMQFSNHWLPIDTHHPIAKHYFLAVLCYYKMHLSKAFWGSNNWRLLLYPTPTSRCKVNLFCNIEC